MAELTEQEKKQPKGCNMTTTPILQLKYLACMSVNKELPTFESKRKHEKEKMFHRTNLKYTSQ